MIEITRRCGPCKMCCVVPRIDLFGKPANVACKHLGPAGCRIYDTRPDQPCRQFHCNWLHGFGDRSTRPDRVGFYTTFGEPIAGSPSLVLHAPEDSFGVWERSKYMRGYIEEFINLGGAVFIICGEKRKVITKNPTVARAVADLQKEGYVPR